MSMINVAVVEDDELIREGLVVVLNEATGFRCVGAFSSAEQALKNIAAINPSIVLMDIQLPGMTGIECLKQLKQLRPEVSVLMLTVFEDNDNVFNSIMAGADGYLLKKTPSVKLVESLRELHNGGAPMNQHIARRILEVFRSSHHDTTKELSKREAEIVDQLVKGFTYKQIGDKLFISPETVRRHLSSIYQKLHVHSKAEAIAKILRPNPFQK